MNCPHCTIPLGPEVIGIEIRGLYDGVLFWLCPYCTHRWHRFPVGDERRVLSERASLSIPPEAA